MNWRHFVPPVLWGMGSKASAAMRVIVQFIGPGRPVYTTQRFYDLAKEGYTQNATAYACINLISRSAAGIPWLLFEQRRGSGTRGKVYVPSIQAKALRNREMKRLVEMDVGHPYLTLLGRPNPLQGGADFTEAAVAYQLLAGNSYIESVEPESGNKPPFELWTLRPDRMKPYTAMGVEAKNPLLIAKWEYEAGGQKQDFAPARILHWKLFNPIDDVFGLSPIQVAARSVDMDNHADSYNLGLIQNGGRPPGVFTVKATPENPYAALQDGQEERLEAKLDERYLEAAKGKRPLFLQGGLGWQEMGMSPVDMAWLATKNVSGLQICRVIMNTPPELVGFTEQKTYSNVREARRALYTESVLPLMDKLRDAYNNWLTPRFGDRLRLEYDIDAIEALQEDRHQLWTSLTNAKWLSINEKRAAAGYDEDPNGDVILVGMAEVPLSHVLAAQQEPTPNPDPTTPPEPTKGAKGLPDLSGEEAKAAAWNSHEARRLVWESVVQCQVQNRFNAELGALQAEFAKDFTGYESRVDNLVSSWEGDWLALLVGSYIPVLNDFGTQTVNELREQAKGWRPVSGVKATPFPTAFDPYEDGVKDWIARMTAEAVTNILETTKQGIKATIAEAMGSGATPDEIWVALHSLYGDFSVNRSIVIARTESVSVANAGSFFAAAQSGLPLNKVWIGTRDTRIRHTHASADGQKQPIDQPFIVGGAKLMFPGDRSMGAPGKEVIQCRCTQGYEIVE